MICPDFVVVAAGEFVRILFPISVRTAAGTGCASERSVFAIPAREASYGLAVFETVKNLSYKNQQRTNSATATILASKILRIHFFTGCSFGANGIELFAAENFGE